MWVAGVEWRDMRAASPQNGNAWELATRALCLDPSHPPTGLETRPTEEYCSGHCCCRQLFSPTFSR
jgi:hypothetical protein